MWIQEAYPSERTRDFVRGIAELAAADLGIPVPSISFYSGWTPENGDGFDDLPVEAMGVARPRLGKIAIDVRIGTDQFAHITAHEVCHIAGSRDEDACCAFAREFEERRLMDILRLLGETQLEHRRTRFYDRQCSCFAGRF